MKSPSLWRLVVEKVTLSPKNSENLLATNLNLFSTQRYALEKWIMSLKMQISLQDKNSLVPSQRVHTEEMPYECKECGNGLVKKPHLLHPEASYWRKTIQMWRMWEVTQSELRPH